MSNIIITAELAAACNALGTYDPKTKIYLADNNIIETVKDVIRYLKKDTESHDFRRFFGDAKIVQLNLIPLLIKYWQQTDLFDVVIRVLGNLTSPVLLLYNEEIPKEKAVRKHFLQILGHLQSYKEALDDIELWAVLCTRLSKLLNIEWHERGTENSLIIERILILVRNVLSIPADLDAEKRPDNDVSAHDKVLWALRTSGLIDIFHYMVSSDQEESYYLYLLEILSLMLREHRPIDLANAANIRTETEKAQDEAEFLSIRRKEMARKNERFRSYTSARHSNFGGTFVFKNVKSVNDAQELIYHKALNKANVLDFDSDKSKVKVPKNRTHLHESPNFRRSTFSIRLLLKHFCIEFLNSGYNKLMQNVRGKLVRGKSVSHDETYYLWALRFFMEFNRHYKFDVKLVSETMSIQIFHYVQQQMEHNFDMVSSDKKKWYLWSKRLHLAVLAYKELLLNLAQMDKSSDASIRDSAKVIKSNVFYVLEYREFLLTLMLTYNPQKMSDAYLLDLIETQHIFMKMLEAFCGGKDTAIVVQKRQKLKKKKSQVAQESAPVISLEETLEIKWDEVSPQLSVVLEGGENIPEIAPFDAASDVPIDDQKKDAMIKIQDYLRENEIENAIGLLRSARNVWPDNDSFGSSSMTPEEEFLAIREIFFAKLRDEEENPTPVQNTYDEENEEDEEDDVEIEREVDLKFIDFAMRFAHPKVIQALGLALRHFETNTVHVNHCILKLLHRIAWDCKMPAMIFQASIFRTFQQIFAERNQPQYKELVKFAIYIVRQFVKVSERNKKVFMELLFWKNSKEAFETEEGYGSYQNKSKAMKAAWTEQQEDELRVLVMEYRDKQIEEDAVDWLMNNLIDNTKTRRMIIKKLKDLMLMDYKGPKKSGGSGSGAARVPQEWGEEEIVQLTELYNQFKDATDPVGCIVDRLDVKRAKNRVKQKIVELGLVADSKALRKKRATKSKSGEHHEGKARSGNPFVNHSSDEELESDSSSDESSKENNKSLHNNVASTSKKTSTSHVSNKKPNKPSTQLNLSVATKSIVQIINLDMTESLKWLSECLTEAAEDQMQDIDLDDNEGIPLVAISESDVVAMDHSVFQKFLLSIGIQKPANEQEMYWRIPGYMKADQLQKIANTINETIEKGGVIVEESTTVDAESSDEDVFDRLRKIVAKPTENENNSANEETSQETNEEKKTKLKKKNVINDSDSDSDDENKLVIDHSQQSNNEINTQTSNVQSSQQSNQTVGSRRTSVQSSPQSSRVTNSRRSSAQSSPQSSRITNSRRSSAQSSPQSSRITNSRRSSAQSSPQSSRITNSRRSSAQSSPQSSRATNSRRSSAQSSPQSSQHTNSRRTSAQSSPQSTRNIDSRRSSVQSSPQSNSQRSSIQSSQQSSSTIQSSRVNSDDENSDKNDTTLVATPQKKKKTRILKTTIDSDESDTENNSTLKRAHISDSETESNATNIKKTKITKILDESGDEASNDKITSKRTRDSGSESEHAIKRKRVIIDSDDE